MQFSKFITCELDAKYIKYKNKLSPFFKHGNAGFICCLLELNMFCDYYATYIDKYQDVLLYNYNNKVSFDYGYCGIIYALIKLYDFYGDKKYIDSIEKKLALIKKVMSLSDNKGVNNFTISNFDYHYILYLYNTRISNEN